MRKAILLGVVAVVFSIAAGPAWADLDEKDVAKIIKLKNENKPIGERLGNYPGNQWVSFVNGVSYVIDLRAQLCFAGENGLVLVSCKVVKKAYPLIAPLITWED